MTNAVTASPVLVALDVANLSELDALLDNLQPSQCRLKVGKELYTRFGPEILNKIQARGFEVFLDLKFHDIPNTVAAAVRVAAELGVWMVNVHASGGEKMMRAAREALNEFGDRAPLLIAVTVLTSMSDSELPTLGLTASTAEEQVLLLATLAKKSGMDGVVCSAREAAMLREQLGPDFLLVTPGIRPANSAADDQTRIVTPVDAMALGSSYLVIGRPITRSENPQTALAAINKDLGIA
ncbi:orotidine-5'-phosphate decarboxylase [Spongiibacter sp. KMU-158]|uniref:Orotidine 5'-phosphate decarboxylase n=1 Tax=Spongiibacter pelagi TaxID=2760804 RepID=A0A927C4B0_9GAMM|nr:orotidine-5'-phosphate decarboxylase [Spongiibacter pelagi]MBD2859913.1 orotidine-5'-phosphate decarboxylase [Spongiibacter pelagi]